MLLFNSIYTIKLYLPDVKNRVLLYKILKFNSTDQNPGNQAGIPDSDRLKFKNCFTEFSAMLNSSIHNDQMNKLMCAARKLNMSLDLSAANVDEKFPTNGQTSDNENTQNCNEYNFDGKSDDEVIQSIKDVVNGLSPDFGQQLSQKFQSGMLCVKTSNFENAEAANTFRNKNGNQGMQFKKFFSHVKEALDSRFHTHTHTHTHTHICIYIYHPFNDALNIFY